MSITTPLQQKIEAALAAKKASSAEGDEPKRSRSDAPRGAITAADLQSMVFAPVRWVVDPYIPAGLTLLAAKPKLGKSWLMLDIAVAVAGGGFTMGDRHCIEGDVLYAALEDSQRRLKERMGKVSPLKGPWPRRLTLWTEMLNLEHGGLDQLRAWTEGAADPRLIVVDTFAKVRSPKARDETAYEADYRQAGQLKQFADETGVAILVVHHVRKMDADDPLDLVSGTTGLTGAADTILVMKREAAGVVLYGRGRDLAEIEIAMEFQRDTCRWRVLGEAAEVRMSDERGAILDALKAAGEPISIGEIVAETGHPKPATRKLLSKMANNGDIQRANRGKYHLPVLEAV